MHSHRPVARLCVAAALFASSEVAAQEIALTSDGQADVAQRHPAGQYTGVKPGGSQQPGVTLPPGTQPATITWPGFEMRADGTSRVFVQLTAPIDTSAAVVGGKLVIDFGSAPIAGTTNRLPIYPKFFNTPVTAIELKRVKKRTTLELTLRAPREPRISSETASSGYYFVYIDFPAGNYLQGTTTAASAAPPAAPPTSNLNEPPEPPGTSTFSGEASGSASASGDAELPPGMGKVKAGGKAKGKAKASGSIGF